MSNILSEFCAMPGWASATEALSRGVHHAEQLKDVHTLVLMSSRSLLHTLLLPSHTTKLRESTSLACTARKLLWPYVRAGPSRHSPGRERRLQQQQPAWGDEELPLFLAATAMEVLAAVGKGLNDTLQKARDGREGTYRWRTFSVSVCTGTTSSSDREGADVLDSPVHRLLAITALTLTHMCVWARECRVVRGGEWFQQPDWLAGMSSRCLQLCDPGLGDLVRPFLTPSDLSAPRLQSKAAGVWEHVAASRFHGRLLAGCCNLACSNLGGVSEAALRTQLCAGCRGARYCSVECQRAAWKEGGHSMVCQKDSGV